MELLEDFDYTEGLSLDFSEGSSSSEEETDTDIPDNLDEDEEELEDEDQEEQEEDTEEQDEDLEDQEEDGEASFSGVVEFLDEYGLIPEDLELDIDDSPEGMAELFEAIADKKFETLLDGLSDKAKALLEVELNGGDIEDAFQNLDDIDYSNIDIEDQDVRKQLLVDYYSAINPKWTEAKIEKKVETLMDLGDDEEEAQEAIEFFTEQQAANRQAYLEQLQQEQLEREAYIQQELEEYHEIIDNSDALAGIPFTSKREKEEFRSYLFDRGKDGLTQAERDDMDKEVRITKEFYKFKKFSFDNVQKRATTDAVVKLKKTVSRFRDTNAGGSKQENTRRTNNGFSLGDII